MSINNRYQQPHPAGAVIEYGLDFSTILPPGVTISDGRLAQQTNQVPPQPTNDFTIGPVQAIGRRLYAQLAGGAAGTDYQLIWTATDSQGGIWPRTVLLLCASTS